MSREPTLSRAFFYSCAALIAGMGGALWGGADVRVAWMALGASAVFAGIALAGNRRFFVVAALCASAAFGIYAGDRALEGAVRNDIRSRVAMGRESSFTGQIVREIDLGESRANLTVLPEGVRDGFILVSLQKSRAYEFQYGDVVALKGVVEEPPVFEGFNYREYLEKERVYARMQDPFIEREARRAYRGVLQRAYGLVLDWKEVANAIIGRGIPYPQAPLLKALLFGSDGEMPESMKDVLNKTGVRHMVAVSGQHVAILIPLFLSLFLSAGMPRRGALGGALAAIILFIVFAGMSASAVRAGIMGVAALSARMLGRMSSPLRPFIFAAAVMLLINPLLLSRDVGFQLSFAATLGIILLYPWMRGRLPFFARKGFFGDAITLTISAQIFTLPLSIQNFHYVSLVSLATNAVSAPLMPVFMILGFAFLYASLISPFLGMLIGFPLSFLLAVFERAMNFFAALPFASLEGAAVSGAFLALYGAGVAWLIWTARKEGVPASEDVIYYTR
ncbi:MAG: ComEC/Rec2 family competence protein [Candidatus Wildermuthbacteria bacterium]|nr:ComEC/Rec2 family competence protein [Candidatus Wildermuthbacteria bacterium]